MIQLIEFFVYLQFLKETISGHLFKIDPNISYFTLYKI